MPDETSHIMVSATSNKDIADKLTPKKLDPQKMWRCPNTFKGANETDPEVVCNNVHFRHAGYLSTPLPFVDDEGPRVAMEHPHVYVCTKCKKCYTWRTGQVYDVTEFIDLKAWEKTEKEMHAATGPGGQC